MKKSIGTKPRFGFPRMQFEESGMTYVEWAAETPEGRAWAKRFQGPSFRDISDEDIDAEYDKLIADKEIKQMNGWRHREIPPKLEGVPA